MLKRLDCMLQMVNWLLAAHTTIETDDHDDVFVSFL